MNDRITARHYTGSSYDGHLSVEVDGISAHSSRRPPLDVSLRQVNGGWLAVPSDMSGGLRGGDRHQIDIRVQGGSHLEWLGPGATLYHQCGELEAVQDTCIFVAGDSSLVFRPRPNIPCRHSRPVQHTSLDLESGAGLYWWDCWTLGRLASGENGEFHEIRNSLRLTLGGKLLYRENSCLRPGPGLGSLALMAGNGGWITALASGEEGALLLERDRQWIESRGGEGESALLAPGVRLYKARMEKALDLAGFARQRMHMETRKN